MLVSALAPIVALLAWAPASETAWGEKALGLVVVGPGGGADWGRAIAEVRKQAGTWPVEVLTGDVGARDLQRAFDRLQAAQARKIAIVPLELFSRSPRLDQLRYLAGVEEYPSKVYLESARQAQKGRVVPRAKAKVPLVFSDALDADEAVSEVLLARARELSKEAPAEAVVLLAAGLPEEDSQKRAEEALGALAKKLREAGGFRSVEAVFARETRRGAGGTFTRFGSGDGRFRPTGISGAAGAMQEAKEAISRAARGGKTLVIPYLLSADGTERAWQRGLQGVFFQWRGRALLPDERLSRWVARRAAAALSAPDMAKHKDGGKALPAESRQRFVP